MLVLTRRVSETVMIGDDVTITAFGAKGNQLRVGIKVPKSSAVHRNEKYERITCEQRVAAKEGQAAEPVSSPVLFAIPVPRWACQWRMKCRYAAIQSRAIARRAAASVMRRRHTRWLSQFSSRSLRYAPQPPAT